MATLQDHWQEISQDARFTDLPDDKKEKVRQRLWDQYVQTDSRYLNLPESKRITVRQRYDEMTKIQQQSLGDEIIKKGKDIVKKVAPIARAGAAGLEVAGKDVAQRAGQAVDVSKIPSDLEDMASTGVEIPGAKKLAASVQSGFEKAGEAIEPSEERLGHLSEVSGTSGALTPTSQFDFARAAASGAVKTTGDFLAGLIPETNIGLAGYFADPVFKFAGSTFLGKPIGELWKPKTGLSKEANAIGDQFEKIITKRRIENMGRQALDGPAKPLEVLANKEAQVAAQNEVQAYNDWLQQADALSARGGEPTGDIYPDAKTNVSQLRDAAQERLRKLQNEPVRVESLSRSEDALGGYYRRQADKARVYMMPAGSPAPRQGMLPEPRSPGFPLLGEGKPGTPTPEIPTERPRISQEPAPKSPEKPPVSMGLRAKDVLTKSYSAYYPDQPKQAIQSMVGASLKAFDFKPNQELSMDHLKMLDIFMEQEHQKFLESQAAEKALPVKSETARLREKGLDPLKVQTEAKRLSDEHNLKAGYSPLEQFIKSESGLKKAPGMEEEHIRNVKGSLSGNVMPDDMAQRAFEANLLPDASANSMYEELSKTKNNVTRPRSQRSFLDEAERNIEGQVHRDAGLFSEAESFSLGGAQAEPPQPVEGAGEQTSMPGTQAQFPEKPLRDLKNSSTFDLLNDINRNLGETGGGGGEIDPVKQAALEAAVKELVDRAMAMGYETTQDIMLYAARNAPKELQEAFRKNLAPTLSAFDTHAYKQMDEAKKGNPIARKDMLDTAQRNYLQKKMDVLRGAHKKFKANQQVVLFKDMDEGLMRLQNDLFIHDNYRKFSKDELAAQRWFIEGKSPNLDKLTALGVPEDQAKRWLDLAKNPTENMKKARQMTQVFEDEYHELISEFYDKVGYVEDHVTRRWKQSREYLDWEGRTLGNKPNFLKGRKLLTQADGINAGYEPVSFDIRDDLRASNNTRVNTLSRIHAYQKLGASFGPEGLPAIIDEAADVATQAKNAKITPHQGQAPNSWLRFEHVPLLKGLAINPYYKPAMKFMMTRPFEGTTPAVLDFLSASTKATKLYGFFHGYTLGEMLFSGISYRDVFSFSKDRNVLFRGLRYMTKAMTADMEGEAFSKNPIKAMGQLYHSFMTGSGVLANRPLSLEMAENGFKFGSADEDMHGILTRVLNQTEDFLQKRIGEKVAKGITALPRLAVDLQEKALWSYIRPVSSMLVYETNLADALEKNLELPLEKRMSHDAIKQAIVNQTSKEMGGISYARLMIDPKTQQVLQWLMLAPGWTIGRALMGASVMQKGPEGRQARKQMAKLFVSWFVASNMINYSQTKKYLGKGRFLWENPEGYRDQAFLKKESDGTTRYIQMSKALTEIYDDVVYPMRTAAYKLGAPVQAAAKIMNWATAKSYYPGLEPENPLKAVLHAYEPMITSGQSAYGGIPVRKGPSKNKIEGVLDEYYKGGMKNQALFQEAMQMATENGYDISKLDRAVRAARTYKERRDLLK